jgi:hypothetical protein
MGRRTSGGGCTSWRATSTRHAATGISAPGRIARWHLRCCISSRARIAFPTRFRKSGCSTTRWWRRLCTPPMRRRCGRTGCVTAARGRRDVLPSQTRTWRAPLPSAPSAPRLKGSRPASRGQALSFSVTPAAAPAKGSGFKFFSNSGRRSGGFASPGDRAGQLRRFPKTAARRKYTPSAVD